MRPFRFLAIKQKRWTRRGVRGEPPIAIARPLLRMKKSGGDAGYAGESPNVGRRKPDVDLLRGLALTRGRDIIGHLF